MHLFLTQFLPQEKGRTSSEALKILLDKYSCFGTLEIMKPAIFIEDEPELEQLQRT